MTLNIIILPLALQMHLWAGHPCHMSDVEIFCVVLEYTLLLIYTVGLLLTVYGNFMGW